MHEWNRVRDSLRWGAPSNVDLAIMVLRAAAFVPIVGMAICCFLAMDPSA